MATVWMIITVLKCRRLHFLCMPYSHFKSTNLHITVCGEWILIERDWIGFTVTLLLVIYIKKQKNITTSLCPYLFFFSISQRRKYKIRKANTGRALDLHAALYEEFQRTEKASSIVKDPTHSLPQPLPAPAIR